MSGDSDLPLRTYKGSCHCSKFIFEFEHPEIKKAMSCNCSICSQRAYVFAFTDNDHFKFTAGSFEELSKYLFGKKQYSHEFCPNCGCGIVATGKGAVLVNLRSVEGIAIDSLEVGEYDGKSIPLGELRT